MVKFGRCFLCLEVILVKNCIGEDFCEEIFDFVFFGWINKILLRLE